MIHQNQGALLNQGHHCQKLLDSGIMEDERTFAISKANKELISRIHKGTLQVRMRTINPIENE